jgi:hypothetical protein
MSSRYSWRAGLESITLRQKDNLGNGRTGSCSTGWVTTRLGRTALASGSVQSAVERLVA